MNILILTLFIGVLLGIILTNAYIFYKKEEEISNAKIDDIVIIKDNKMGYLMEIYKEFDYANTNNDLIYEIADIPTSHIRQVKKSMICHVIKWRG